MPGFFLLCFLSGCGQPDDVPEVGGEPARMTIPGTLENKDIDEASGLAYSTRGEDILWTHNDSGAKARIYAIDPTGRTLGRIKLEESDNVDWEDIASFNLDGVAGLVVADIGDNDARRENVTLYLVEEPDLGEDDRPELEAQRRIDFVYPDGPRDAEAMAVDSESRRALILSKRDLPPILYAVPLSPTNLAVPVAQRLGPVLSLPEPSRRDIEFAPDTKDWHWQPTAMDISPDRQTLVILTYRAVYYYKRIDCEDWFETLQRPPLVLDLGNIRDAEAIAFGPDGRSIFVSVERQHAPLLRIDLLGEP